MSELQRLLNFRISPLKPLHTNVRIFLLEAPPVEKFQIMYGLQWENLEFWEAITIHPINFESGMQPIGMVTNGYKGFLLS